jgi:hypothetical protein
MAFFPFSRKPQKKTPKTTSQGKANNQKSELELKLEAIRRREQEILEKAEQAKRQVEDIPKLLEERKRRERELIKDRARKSKTLRGLDKPSYRLPSVLAPQRMTRGQERAQFTRFLILCTALLGVLLLLWRAAR